MPKEGRLPLREAEGWGSALACSCFLPRTVPPGLWDFQHVMVTAEGTKVSAEKWGCQASAAEEQTAGWRGQQATTESRGDCAYGRVLGRRMDGQPESGS